MEDWKLERARSGGNFNLTGTGRDPVLEHFKPEQLLLNDKPASETEIKGPTDEQEGSRRASLNPRYQHKAANLRFQDPNPQSPPKTASFSLNPQHQHKTGSFSLQDPNLHHQHKTGSFSLQDPNLHHQHKTGSFSLQDPNLHHQHKGGSFISLQDPNLHHQHKGGSFISLQDPNLHHQHKTASFSLQDPNLHHQHKGGSFSLQDPNLDPQHKGGSFSLQDPNLHHQHKTASFSLQDPNLHHQHKSGSFSLQDPNLHHQHKGGSFSLQDPNLHHQHKSGSFSLQDPNLHYQHKSGSFSLQDPNLHHQHKAASFSLQDPNLHHQHKSGSFSLQDPNLHHQHKGDSFSIQDPNHKAAARMSIQDANPQPQHKPGSLSLQDKEKEWKDEEDGLRLVKEAAYTLVEKECAADDVIRVWEEISKFIIFKMMEGQAVRIAGLGTFTYRIQKTPVNQKSFKITKAPVFIISGRVQKMYCLTQVQPYVSNVPMVPLNLSVIALETNLPRGMIEGILTEVLQAFARGVVCNKALEFPFLFIGKLQVRDQRVTMKFYSEFCKKLGFTGTESDPLNDEEDPLCKNNMIPGRMTPLRMHIPSENYRSVFHLREVRSVHENSIVIPLVKVKGKYVAKTMMSSSDIGSRGSFQSVTQLQEWVPPVPSVDVLITDPEDNSNENEEEEEVDASKTNIVEGLAQADHVPKPASPLYQPSRTGDCILNLMNRCPEIMTQCVRAKMYQIVINTLGQEVVKSHFHRRENKGPCRTFSVDDLGSDDKAGI